MNRKFLLSAIALVFVGYGATAQVGINTSTPNTKTLLHVSETNGTVKSYKGVMVPTFTTAERDANFTGLAVADNGLLIYNTTDNCYNYYKRPAASTVGTWINMCNPTKPASGIVASYIGAPVIVQNSSSSEMETSSVPLASSRTPAKYKLAKDDLVQLDFGNSQYAGTTQIYLRNISSAPITITYTAYSDNSVGLDPITTITQTIPAGGLSNSLDPYIGGPTHAFGIAGSFQEAVSVDFTLTTAGMPDRKYFAVFTSARAVDGAIGSAVRTELHQYVE